MKRRAILFVTDCEEKRFDTLLFRRQLPFVPAPLPMDLDLTDPLGDRAKRRADYSIADAFLLRLMLDFMDQGGVDVESARYAANNALGRIGAVADVPGQGDIYVAHVAEKRIPGEDFNPMQLFACRLADLERILSERTDPDQVRRITLVSASAASRFVLARAAEFDLFPEHDTRPAWDMGGVF